MTYKPSASLVLTEPHTRSHLFKDLIQLFMDVVGSSDGQTDAIGAVRKARNILKRAE